MDKPLIGINPNYFEKEECYWHGTKEPYANAIWNEGGIPVTLHYPTNGCSVIEIADKIDGLVIVGGPDLPTKIYNGKNPESDTYEIMHPKRELFDRAIFLAVKQKGKPILATCAGLQHINVIYGGSLYEDIPSNMESNIEHYEVNGNYSTHAVNLETGSLVHQVMETRCPSVSSTHHQGIRELGRGLKAVGWSSDGLIEAIEDERNPKAFLAVQWHPELMPESLEQMRLFSWLVKIAGKIKI